MKEVEHCWIPLPDGVRLSARLWLPAPADGAPVPAILEYIPYRKRDLVRARDERNHPFFARHGYACVRVDMRGSGDSEGVMTDMYGEAELDDALAVIDWISEQPWCDGAVGMMGTSWGGTASLQAASRRPAALRAILAVCATDNRFDDDIHHMGGCLLTDTVEWGATLPAILAAPPDSQTLGPGWRDQWMQRLEGLSSPLHHWIEHEIRDAYWRHGSVNEATDAIVCPLLAIGGWVDRYSNTVMNLLAAAHDRCWGIVGPWGHHYPDVAAPGPGIGFQQEALRWWDRWLKGLDNGVDREPRLRVWLQDYVEPSNQLNHRPGCWISESSWPSANVEERDLWLVEGQLLDQPVAGERAIEVPFDLRVGRASGDTGYFGREGGLPLDQGCDDACSLVFESAPLEEPLVILGRVGLNIALAADRPVAKVVARLNDVAPDGEAARVTYVIRNLALDDSGAPVSGKDHRETRSLHLHCWNTAYRFAAGHRLRLALSCSYWPLVWPDPKPVRLTAMLNDARLSLPVRRGDVGAEVTFATPQVVPNDDVATRSVPLERWSECDRESATRRDGWHQPFKEMRFERIDLIFGFETRADHRIELHDPNSASTRFEHRLHFSRQDWTVEIVSVAELTSTPTHYRIRGAIEVRENDDLVFERKWTPEIERRYS